MELDTESQQLSECEIESSESSDSDEANAASDEEMLSSGKKTGSPRPVKPPAVASRLKSLCSELSWKNIVAIVCLWIAYFLCAAGFSTIAPFFPDEAMEKGASSAMVGVIISVTPLAVVVLAPVSGYLLPYTGAWIPTMSGLAIVGVSYILLGLALYIPSIWGFIFFCLLLRVLEGVGAAMFTTATFSTFAKLFPNAVGTLMGLFQVALGAGYSLGRPVGGLLYYLGGYKLPFIALGAATFVFALPCGLLVRNIKFDKKDRTLSWRIILSFSTDLFFIVTALILMTGYVVVSYVTPILQPYLIDMYDQGPIGVAMVYFVAALSYALTDLPAGAVADKMNSTSSVHISALGLLVMTVGVLILAIQEWTIKKLWVVYVAVTIMGIGLGVTLVPVYPNLIRVAKRYVRADSKSEVAGATSFTSGVVSSSLFLGQFLGPVLGGVLYSFFSFPITSLVFAEISLAMAVLVSGVTIIDKLTYQPPSSSKHLTK